jgi:hypothetical protein
MTAETVVLGILRDVTNGSRGSSQVSGRLTDHLAIGVLSGLIHRDIVDDVIRECGRREKRSRLLPAHAPAHVVVYYVLALNLFFGEAYEEVMRQLVNGLRFLGKWRDTWTVPSTSAISQARTRLGEAPLKLLFERIAVPMARAGTRGSWFRGLRVMAIDGLMLDVPDTPANDEEFGRSGNDTTPARSPSSGWSPWVSAAPTRSSTPRWARSPPASRPSPPS